MCWTNQICCIPYSGGFNYLRGLRYAYMTFKDICKFIYSNISIFGYKNINIYRNIYMYIDNIENEKKISEL